MFVVQLFGLRVWCLNAGEGSGDVLATYNWGYNLPSDLVAPMRLNGGGISRRISPVIGNY